MTMGGRRGCTTSESTCNSLPWPSQGRGGSSSRGTFEKGKITSAKETAIRVWQYLVLLFLLDGHAVFAHGDTVWSSGDSAHVLGELLLLHLCGVAHVEVLSVHIFVVNNNQNLIVRTRLNPRFGAVPI